MTISFTIAQLRAAVAWVLSLAGVTLVTIMAGIPGIPIPGVADDHTGALLTIFLLPLSVHLFARGMRRRAAEQNGLVGRACQRYVALSPLTKASALMMAIGAAVHAALIPGHLVMEPLLGILFAADTAGLAGAALLAVAIRRWHLPVVFMGLSTLGGYLFYIVSGREGMDPLGVATTAIEVMGSILAAVHFIRTTVAARPSTRRRIFLAVPAFSLITAGMLAATVFVATQTPASAAAPTTSAQADMTSQP